MPRPEMIAMLAIVGPVLSLAQRLAPETLQERTRLGRSWDLAFIAQYLVLLPSVGVLTAGLIGGVDSAVPVVADWPFVLRLTVALVGVDVVLYGLHRAAHRWSWLWRLHAVHHRPAEVGWPVAFRVHLGEAAIHHSVPFAMVAAVGVGADAVAVTVAAVMVVTVLAHTNVWVPAGRGQRLIATPRFHRTHHEAGRGTTNFAVLFPIWDVIFSSADFRVGEGRRFGIGSAQEQHTDTERGDVGDAAYGGTEYLVVKPAAIYLGLNHDYQRFDDDEGWQ